MKVQKKKSNQAGNTLLVVMMFAGILTAALGSYLTLTAKENKAVMRSLCWNSALPLAEAGIEEAMSQINQNLYNYAADGWTQNGTNYSKQRTLGDSYYTVNIAGAPGSLVTITSTGYSHWVDTTYLSRDLKVTVQTSSSATYPGMIATNLTIGGNFSADSYDSSTNSGSTGGAYDKTKHSAKAFIASPSTGFTVSGSSSIRGYVAAGPGGTVTAKGAGSVGDLSWNSKGIEPGHATNGFVTSIPDVTVPYTSANAPASGTVNGTTYDYVLEGGKYMASALTSGKSGGNMVVTSDSTLYVTGNTVDLSKIVFQNGAKLDLYLGGSSINFSPVLEGHASTQFRVLGLPTCTSMALNGGTDFTGIIYAPECDLKFTGNASMSGAITAHGVDAKGTFDFHYDLATGVALSAPTVTIISWAEPY